MTSLFPFAMRAISFLDSAHQHPELADAIAAVVEEHRPILADDEDKTRTTSLMIAIAYRESTFQNNAVGDHGTSHCAYQINLSAGAKTTEGWSADDLKTDINKCVRVAFRMLRQSVRIDSKAPVAFYARGPAWKSEEAQRISRDRCALATRVRTAALGALKEST